MQSARLAKIWTARFTAMFTQIHTKINTTKKLAYRVKKYTTYRVKYKLNLQNVHKSWIRLKTMYSRSRVRFLRRPLPGRGSKAAADNDIRLSYNRQLMHFVIVYKLTVRVV